MNLTSLSVTIAGYAFVIFLIFFLVIIFCVHQAYDLQLAVKIKPMLMFSESSLEELLKETQQYRDYLMDMQKKSSNSYREWQQKAKNKLHARKQRSKPKHILRGYQAKSFEILVGIKLIFFASVVVAIGIYFVIKNADQAIEMVQYEEAITGSYILLNDLSNQLDHSGTLSLTAY